MDCGGWNTLEEEEILPEGRGHGMALHLDGQAQVVAIEEVDTEQENRFTTGIDELDRVLGGGVVPGSLLLLGGPPGVGKSTLLLQMARTLAGTRPPVLYVSGEESPRQIRMRADRLGAATKGILLLGETRLEAIESHLREIKPGLVLVDSIQTLFRSDLAPAPGSVTQVRECAANLMRMAKATSTPVVLVGHFTKDGQLAGPRVLEHLVDTVLSFEGEGLQHVRALRATKNRFGPSHEVGLFEMGPEGLTAIPDASAFFLSQRARGTSGSVVFPSLEGSRPMLVEIQALVSSSKAAENGGMAARRSVGLDPNRLSLLLAVLHKRCPGFEIWKHNVYANVAGGLRLAEPGLDLPLVLAVASSCKETCLDPNLAAMGEIGLGGEVRPVSNLEPRLKELAKMGFTTCLLPSKSLDGLNLKAFKPLQVKGVSTIKEALSEAGIPIPRPREDEPAREQPREPVPF